MSLTKPNQNKITSIQKIKTGFKPMNPLSFKEVYQSPDLFSLARQNHKQGALPNNKIKSLKEFQ